MKKILVLFSILFLILAVGSSVSASSIDTEGDIIPQAVIYCTESPDGVHHIDVGNGFLYGEGLIPHLEVIDNQGRVVRVLTGTIFRCKYCNDKTKFMAFLDIDNKTFVVWPNFYDFNTGKYRVYEYNVENANYSPAVKVDF